MDAETGEEIWRYTIEEYQDPQSTPAIEGSSVYILSKKGILCRLNVTNGKARWKKDLVKDFQVKKIKFGFAGSVVVERDLLVLNANSAGIVLNKKSGEMVWTSDVPTTVSEGAYATPVIYSHEGKRRALFFTGTGLSSEELETGKRLWYYEWWNEGAPNVADPVLIANHVFISRAEHSAACALLNIEGQAPKVVWQNDNMKNHVSTCVYIDGYLYGPDGDAGEIVPLRCLDAKTGDVMW